MHIFKYIVAKILCKLCHSDEPMNRYHRRAGVAVGMNCHIYSDLAASESYLIEIGDNVTISNGVQFITHDNSVCKVMPQFTDIFGRIKIGENSFIGAKSIVMMGVNIPANTIVGAGSVVTRSFVEERTIIAGNPARIIGNWDAYESKYSDLAVDISGFAGEERKRRIIESAEKLALIKNN